MVFQKDYVVIELNSCNGGTPDEIIFFQVDTTLPTESLALAGLSLNLKTNVSGFPGTAHNTQAPCYPGWDLRS